MAKLVLHCPELVVIDDGRKGAGKVKVTVVVGPNCYEVRGVIDHRRGELPPDIAAHLKESLDA